MVVKAVVIKTKNTIGRHKRILSSNELASWKFDMPDTENPELDADRGLRSSIIFLTLTSCPFAQMNSHQNTHV